MDLIVFVLELIGGLVVGSSMFSLIVLPPAYGLRKAIYWGLKGRLRWWSIVRYVVAPALWTCVFALAILAVYFFWPRLADRLVASGAFTGGFAAGFVLTLLRAWTSSGRTDQR